MSPWEWDDAIHGWRNIDTGEVFTVDDALARIEELVSANAALRKAIDAMLRECGSEPNSRYARNACIIGAAALASPPESEP